MRCDYIQEWKDKNYYVSIHTPTWGVTTYLFYYYSTNISFNPHTYMRCDDCFIVCWLSCLVSIHTPTWGVTRQNQPGNVILTFQSTHLHEVWLSKEINIVNRQCFNPHTYMRCDFSVAGFCPVFVVSIHTPTWGVTLLFAVVRLFSGGFNPHTYMRCDQAELNVKAANYVSIHTPTWGVTQLFRRNEPFKKVSIHTPTWGVTYEWCTGWYCCWFQSTHLHEVWHYLDMKVFEKRLFQSTHLHEVWHTGGFKTQDLYVVSIHTPTWGVTIV